MQQLVFAVLGLTTALGAALFWALRADRRRAGRQQRLQAVIGGKPGPEEPVLSLRRPRPRQGIRSGFLLSAARARLEAALAAAGNWIGVPHLAAAAAMAALAAILLANRLLGLGAALSIALGFAAALGAGFLLLDLVQRRYRNRFLDVFPDALDMIGRAVRAGLPVFDAMEVAGHEVREPVGVEFRRTLDEMRIGVEIQDALQHTADRIRVPDFRFYVVALILQRRTGGSLAETLGNLSSVIRRRKEIRLKARALTAEAKMSAVVLGILPFVVGGLMFLLNRGLMSVLLTDHRGRLLLGLAMVSLMIGIAVMILIIKRSLR